MGSEGFDIYLDEINARVIAAIPGAAARAMEMIRTEVARQTPIDTGNLVGSEEVVPHEDGADIYIPGPYSRNQHYSLDFHHDTGNALYLELPMVQKAPEAVQMIADDLRKAI
jgi:ribosomal protein L31E